MLAKPYSLTEGCRTLVGHALIQSEQAVHLEMNDSMLTEPGGETG